MLWHPTKLWSQTFFDDNGNPVEYKWPDEGSLQLYSDPPGLLDSGRYWVNPDTGEALAPYYYKCLSCCCTPAKCNMPTEILMTISGFSGTLSSVDRPAAFGYGAGNVCSECSILWSYTDTPGNPGHRWSGYNDECCKCRKQESFYWWPRNIAGPNADGGNICARDRAICASFPWLCSASAEPVKTGGRIAARYINPCVEPCTYFTWADDPIDGSGKGYSLVELTDCAKAPNANARADYNCITQNKIDVVRANDSYLYPPGFRGPGSVNLLPMCGGLFWNDRTYYRFCVRGGFWCQIPDYENHCYCDGNFFGTGDFFQGLYAETVANNGWRTGRWCDESPTRCNGPVPIEQVKWEYYRPQYVLTSQPSVANCAHCPGYGFGYGSDFTNYGRGTDWYDPYDDGNCIGKTDVEMSDFNQSFMLYSEVVENPPNLQVNVNRSRIKPAQEPRLIDVQLLYQCKQYSQNSPYCSCFGFKQNYWNLDYPCEPKYFDTFCMCSVCNLASGMVAPKLQAYYMNSSGAGAEIKFRLQPYCSNIDLEYYGPFYNGSFWYVSAVFVDENARGVDYSVGDKFIFDFYESPSRGGEAFLQNYEGKQQQDAVVTKVGPDGEILGIELVAESFSKCQFRRNFPIVPLYVRFLPHRLAVGIPGNGYQEGDVLTFEPIGSEPENAIPTGNRYYPYFKTAVRYRAMARATVVEVDSRGGVVDWYMCGAQNNFNYYDYNDSLACTEDHTGYYFTDYKYTNVCEYNYGGVIPVRYAWSGFFDYHFHQASYCEHAWAEFGFKIDQISVKNTISVTPPPNGGKRALLKISGVSPMTVFSVPVNELRYQNYERSPGPSDYTDYVYNPSGEGGAWFRSHRIPVPQGTVARITVVEPGSGYVKKVIDDEETGAYHWEPLEVSTEQVLEGSYGVNGIYIRGVADDIRDYASGYFGWQNVFCKCRANINMNENSDNFGGIQSVDIIQGGLWYFHHEHDHVWFAQVSTNWYFELADPLSEDNPLPRNLDLTDYNGADCWHASRDNWGELQHYDGFAEPYSSGYHSQTSTFPGNVTYTSYFCNVNSGASNYAWPLTPLSFTGGAGTSTAGDDMKRWSLSFCPNDLLNKSFRMILLHPCAACAKELSIPGSQTCWNMNGFGDTTYSIYPNNWAGTGTAMITRLADQLTCTISLPTD